MSDQTTRDFAETLKKHFSSAETIQPGPPRFRLGRKNQRKLERIREKVEQLRGGR